MNLILLFADDFIAPPQADEADARVMRGRVRLTGRRLEHVREIHRAELGDELCVGLVNQRIGRGVICNLDDQCPWAPLSATRCVEEYQTEYGPRHHARWRGSFFCRCESSYGPVLIDRRSSLTHTEALHRTSSILL